MAVNSEENYKPGRKPDPHGGDQQARFPEEEAVTAPLKDGQHGGDFSRGSVERNRNQGGFDGKR